MDYLSDNINENQKIALMENLPLPQMLTLCETNRFYRDLCNGFHSNRIFETRSRNEFSNEILELKEPTMSWKEFYIQVHKFNRRELIFYQYGPSSTNWFVQLFEEKALLELKLLYLKLRKDQQTNLLNSLRMDYQAAFYNFPEFLNWLFERHEINPDIMLTAIRKGNIDIVKWLVEIAKVQPSAIDASMSLYNNNLAIAEYFSNLTPAILPDLDFNFAPRVINNRAVSDWLQSKGLPQLI